MQKTIRCVDHYGKWYEIAVEKFVRRISAYGILIEENTVFLAREKWNKKWLFPGGGVEIGESIEDCPIREFQEQTGMAIAIDHFHSYVKSNFYAEDRDIAWDSTLMFFVVKKMGGILHSDLGVQDVDAVAWKKKEELNSENTHEFTYKILKELKFLK